MGRNQERQLRSSHRHLVGHHLGWVRHWRGYWSLIGLIVASAAFGHGGRTDSSGGHNSSSGYHYHGGGSSSYTPTRSFGSSYRSSYPSSYRSTARTAAPVLRSDSNRLAEIARLREQQKQKRAEEAADRDAEQARRVADLEAKRRAAEEEATRLEQEHLAQEAKDEAHRAFRRDMWADTMSRQTADYWRDARYLLHHVEHNPVEVVIIQDAGDDWRVVLTDGSVIRIPKDEIVRVEPVNCPTEYRTWVDSSGRFSSVGKIDRIKLPHVRVNTIDGRTFTVSVDKLSETDQDFVESIADGYSDSDSEPIFKKVSVADQAAKVHRFCVIQEGSFWKASAEVEQTTLPRKIGGQTIPTNFSIAGGTVHNQFPKEKSVESLIHKNFPPDIWEDMTGEAFEALKLEHMAAE